MVRHHETQAFTSAVQAVADQLSNFLGAHAPLPARVRQPSAELIEAMGAIRYASTIWAMTRRNGEYYNFSVSHQVGAGGAKDALLRSKTWFEKLQGVLDTLKQDDDLVLAQKTIQQVEVNAEGWRRAFAEAARTAAAIRKNSCLRDNVFVFIDEAHRSVAKDLGTYLMAAVPNATIIGFTGTPIAKTAHGEGTFKIFGADDERGYLDKYSIRESIDDETTIPIKHMLAPSTMTVPAEQLDKEFFELAGSEGVTDVEELNKVLDRAVGLRTFLTADDRIEQVAAFVAEHFKENVLPLGYSP